MNELRNYIVEETIKKLKDYEKATAYACELAYTLFESENVNGSYTCSTYNAKQWIQEYFEELGEVVEEINANFGYDFVPNMFNEPEKFQVITIIECSSYLLGQCQSINDNWNNEIELTEEIINKIIEELEELKSYGSYDFYI